MIANYEKGRDFERAAEEEEEEEDKSSHAAERANSRVKARKVFGGARGK